MTTTFTITPRGPFSLREAALFGFGPRAEKSFDGVLRLAFCLDGYREQVGVEVREDPAGLVVASSSAADAVRDQVARVLSLDHDGDEFRQVGRVDPVLGRLQAAVPGLRPVLFHSPYEAAVWSILSARRARAQAATLRERLSREYGQVFSLAGTQEAALPTPEQLLRVTSFPGLPDARIPWLHGIAQAALDGQLDAATLAAAEPEAATAALQRLAGIGPFYAALIHLRSTGVTDVLPTSEPRVLALAGELYGRPGPMTQEEFAERAQSWRPWRTWASVLIRAASRRLPAPG